MNKIPDDQKAAKAVWEAAQQKAKIAEEKFEKKFDRLLKVTDRPITLRDLMFALVVLGRYTNYLLEALTELHDDVPKHERLADQIQFDVFEHSSLRQDLFELYFAHAGVDLGKEFFDKFVASWKDAKHESAIALEAYRRRKS